MDSKNNVIYLNGGVCGCAFPSLESVVPPEEVRSLVMPVQTHTTNVGIVEDPEQTFPDTDALITMLRGVAVGVRTADCVPVLLHAPDIGAVAAVHAGWKGTSGRIVGKTIQKLVGLGADPGEICAAFGPSVCGLCYEVSRELADIFSDAGLGYALVSSSEGDPAGERVFGQDTIRLDLQRANLGIMLDNGLRPENIVLSDICTRHSGGWPSWRKSPGTGVRLISAIWNSK